MHISTLIELEDARETAKSNDCPLLVQCGSPKCQLCPAFTKEVQKLAIEYKFHFVYINTHTAEEDLIEEIQVTRLPAYIIETADNAYKGQAASPSELREAVSDSCKPGLALGEDF